MKHRFLPFLIAITLVTLCARPSTAGDKDIKTIGGSSVIRLQPKPLPQKPPELSPAEWIIPTNDVALTLTSTNGVKITAALQRFNKSSVVVKADDEQLVQIARTALGRNDQSVLQTIEKQKLAQLQAAWRKQQAVQSGGGQKGAVGNCRWCGGTGKVRETVDTGLSAP